MLLEREKPESKDTDKACVKNEALVRKRKGTATVCQVNNRLMFQLRKQYYKPSKKARLLAILESLSQENELSQNELGRRLGVSSAMVNTYLRQLQSKKLVTFEARNGKSYRYLLTPEGERLRGEMMADYSSEAIQIYSGLKNQISAKLRKVAARGLLKLVLFGASETCEVVLSSLRDSEFKVMALVDNDPKKHGILFHGHVVSPPHILDSVPCHAVLITSFGRQNEIHEQLAPLCARRGLEIERL